MKATYWAVMPASSGPPSWTLDNCRIEKAARAADAAQQAFGRMHRDDSPMAGLDCGSWLAKDLGPRVEVIRSNNKRITALRDPRGWADPFEYRRKKP